MKEESQRGLIRGKYPFLKYGQRKNHVPTITPLVSVI